MTAESHLKKGIQFLADAGLNLFAVLDCAALPDDLIVAMHRSHVPVSDYCRLVLTGHGGRHFWEQLQTAGMETVDPVDFYSLRLTHQFIQTYLENSPHLILYPHTDHFIPLQQLGELAGWCHPSPIGQGIHPTFGLWFAYRTAFLTNYELPIKKETLTPRPCDTCTHKPCLTACPSGAVQPAQFDVFTCADFRISHNSVCADRCLARIACPVAPEHRYTLPQIQYHYLHSLETIRQYQT